MAVNTENDNELKKLELYRLWSEIQNIPEPSKDDYLKLGELFLSYLSGEPTPKQIKNKIKEFSNMSNKDESNLFEELKKLQKEDGAYPQLANAEFLAKFLLKEKISLKDRLETSVKNVVKEIDSVERLILSEYGNDIFNPNESPYRSLNSINPKSDSDEYFKYKVMNALSVNGPVWSIKEDGEVKYLAGGGGEPDYSMLVKRTSDAPISTIQLAATLATKDSIDNIGFETDQVDRHFGIEQIFQLKNSKLIEKRNKDILLANSKEKINEIEREFKKEKDKWKRKEVEDLDDESLLTENKEGSLSKYKERTVQRKIIHNNKDFLNKNIANLGKIIYSPEIHKKDIQELRSWQATINNTKEKTSGEKYEEWNRKTVAVVGGLLILADNLYDNNFGFSNNQNSTISIALQSDYNRGSLDKNEKLSFQMMEEFNDKLIVVGIKETKRELNLIRENIDPNILSYSKKRIEEIYPDGRNLNRKIYSNLTDSRNRTGLAVMILGSIMVAFPEHIDLQNVNHEIEMIFKDSGVRETYKTLKPKQREFVMEEALKWAVEMIEAGSRSTQILTNTELLLKEYKDSRLPKILDKQDEINKSKQIITILARSKNSEKLIKSLEKIFENHEIISPDFEKEILSFNKEETTIHLVVDYNRAIAEARDENKRLVNTNSGRNRSTSKGNPSTL